MMIFQAPQQFVESLPTRPYDPSFEVEHEWFARIDDPEDPRAERYHEWSWYEALFMVIGKVINNVEPTDKEPDFKVLTIYGTPRLLHDNKIHGVSMEGMDDEAFLGKTFQDHVLYTSPGWCTLILDDGQTSPVFEKDTPTNRYLIARFAVDLDYSKIALVKI